MILFLILLVLVMVVAAFDLVPVAIDFVQRIKIGSLKGEQWFAAAGNVAQQWCAKGLPSVPKVAGKRLTLIDRLKGNYKSGTIQSWQSGSVILAMNEIGPEAAKDSAMKYINASTGEWVNSPERVDFSFLAYAILSNPYIDPSSVKPAMDFTADMLIKKFEKHGSVPYSHNPDHRYVDTIGLVCPFLMKYGLVYDNQKAIEVAVSLIKEYEQYGLHPDFSVPVHCYDAKTKAPLGLYSWGRGCGWWATGLSESYKVLENTDSDSYVDEKKVILKNLLSFSKSVIDYQSADGSFDRNIFAASGGDSSATAMIAEMLAYAGKLSGHEPFTQAAKKAMDYIFSVTRRNGIVDYSQGDTMGIGFYSSESIVLPATQGFSLRAYIKLY